VGVSEKAAETAGEIGTPASWIPVMPDLFRHPPGGRRQGPEWPPEQACPELAEGSEVTARYPVMLNLFQHPSRGRRQAEEWTPEQARPELAEGSGVTAPTAGPPHSRHREPRSGVAIQAGACDPAQNWIAALRSQWHGRGLSHVPRHAGLVPASTTRQAPSRRVDPGTSPSWACRRVRG